MNSDRCRWSDRRLTYKSKVGTEFISYLNCSVSLEKLFPVGVDLYCVISKALAVFVPYIG